LPSVGINNINNYNTIYKRLKLNMKNNNSKGNFIMGFNKPKNIRRNNNIISYGYKALGK
jgi:hypothetical protein